MPRLLVTNLSKGEFAPELYGRVDVPQYSAGARRLRNFIVMKYGGVDFRPGTRFVGEAPNTTDAIRYIPFQAAIDQSYILAMGSASMNLLALGGFVLEEDLEIQSITSEAQAVIEVPYHEYVVGQRVYLSGITGMTSLNGRFAEVVAVIDADHVRINVSTVGLPALTGSTGITRTGAPPPPPPPPPAPPPPPPPPAPTTGGGGGSGGGIGGEYTYEREL